MASSSTSSINEKTPAEEVRPVRAESGPQNERATRGGMIDKSLISAPTPGSFVHVAHVGYEVEKGFTSSGVDPSWLAFLGDLQKHGISEDVIEENMDFIQSFVRDAQKNEAPTTGNSPRGSKRAPNPPRRPVPPPPPQRRRSTHAQQQGSTLSTTAPPLAPPLRTQSLGTHHPRTSRDPTSASILVAPQLPVRAPPPPSHASVALPPVPAPEPSLCAVSITASPPPRPGEQGTLLRHATTTTRTTTTTATTTTTVTTTTTTTHSLPNDG